MSVLKAGITISKQKFLFLIYCTLFAFVFYILLSSLVDSFGMAGYGPIVIAIFEFEICLSILFGGFLLSKINRLLLYRILAVALIATSSLIFFVNQGFQLLIILAVTPLFGMALITFLQYFEANTISTERARVAGIIGFVIIPFFMVLRFQNNTLSFFSLLFISVNLAICLYVLSTKKTEFKKGEDRKTYEKRVTIFYFLPWLFFSIINAIFARNVSLFVSAHTSLNLYTVLVTLQAVGITFGAFIAGFLADFFGRRLSLALALTLYGVSAVLGGISATNTVFPVMYLINGISWGILFVIYFFVVWADLANHDNSAKIYSLGLIPYFFFIAIGVVIPQSFLPISANFLVICLMIFASILPLFLCPELVSSDFMLTFRLKQHISNINKIKKTKDK